MNSIIPSRSVLKEKIDEYLHMKRVGIKPRTLVGYQESLNHFYQYVKASGGTVTPQIYSGFIEWLNQNFKPGSVKTHRERVASFFKFCERIGWIRCSPDKLVPRQKPPYKNKPHRFIRREEFEQMCQKAEGTVFEWGLICAYHTGMSQADVCLLKWEDVDMVNNVIRAERIKSGVQMRIPYPIGGELHQWLQGLWNVRSSKDAYVSMELAHRMKKNQPYTSHQFVKYVRSVRSDCNFHDLRHTLCTKLAMDGVPFHVAGKITGHANLNTFAGYVMPDEDQLRIALTKALQWEPKQNQ